MRAQPLELSVEPPMRHEMLEIGGRGLTRFHQILKISRGPRNSTGFREVQRRATKFPGMPVPLGI